MFIYDTGKLICVSPSDMKLKWVKNEIQEQAGGRAALFSLFVDKENCVWAFSVAGLWVYDVEADRWRSDLAERWKGQTDVVHAVA